MSIESDNRINEYTYRVLSIEKIEPPEGMPEGNWHHYVIGRSNSTIEGFQIGSLEAVTQHAKTFADGLNERAGNLGGSTYAVRKKK